MFINVGAIFAPLAAIGVRNWWLGKHGFLYSAELPALCHAHLDGTINVAASESLTQLATKVSATPVADITSFTKDYLNVFTTGFHYAFGVAIFAMAISLTIYLLNKKNFPDAKKVITSGTVVDPDTIQMDVKEVKQRLTALFAVFGVAIFFWLSFHQNGLTLTFFAKEYTDLSLMKISLGGVTLQGAEIFQSINPFFVVFLTPIVLALFGWLRRKGKEPSTPRKIAIGMFIAAMGFLVMAIGSYCSHLPLHSAINPEEGGVPLAESLKVTPFLLITTYFILTVAELFISPLGISFVSKVAPPQYQGVMQGGWLGATAIGNSLLFVGAVLYDSIPIWMTWTLFVAACTLSMFIMIFMLKWLERIAK